MNKMKLVQGSVVLLVALLFVAACTGGRSTTSEVPESKRIHILNSHAGAAYPQQVKEDDPYIAELNRMSGYDITWEFLGHRNDFVQQLTVRFASGDLADLIRTTDIHASMHAGAIENGAFTELGPLLAEHGPNVMKNIPQTAWDSPKVSKDGKIYGIPYLNPLPGTRVVYIRQDWLDKLGMDHPETLDDWVAFFEGVKTNDMNGNGDPHDEYGFNVNRGLFTSDLFFKAFGFHPNDWTYQDGLLQPGIIQPEMKEAIAWWKMLYDNGYIKPNFATQDTNTDIFNNKAGSWLYDYTAYNVTYPPQSFVGQEDIVDLSMIKGPVGPRGDHGLMARSDQIVYVWVIPSSSKKAVEVIQFLDWAWSSEEAQTFFAYGLEGMNYTVEDGHINWDKNSPENQQDGLLPWVFYQYNINPIFLGTVQPKLLELEPNAEKIFAAKEVAEAEIYDHDSMFMPALKAFATRPELVPGLGDSTLFMEMFVKVVTGREPLDEAFDKFVSEWRRRGGDAAIEEATAWYKSFHNQ